MSASFASQSDAFLGWAKYAEYVEDLVHLTHEGYRLHATLPTAYGSLGDAVDLESSLFRSRRALREIEDGFWMLHSHALMGLWSALESLIENVCVARIMNNRSLLASEGFRKVRIPASTLAENDEEMLARAAYVEILKACPSGKAPGRFENILKTVGIDGQVPASVSRSVFDAHRTRNICAHKSGIIDNEYLQNGDVENLKAGDRVPLDFPAFARLMHGIHMYAIVILNRWRLEQGKALIRSECSGYEGSLSEVFGSAP